MGDFKRAYYERSSGGDGSIFGLEIDLEIGRPLTDNDRRSIYRAVDQLKEDLYTETCKVDPRKLALKEQWLAALFKTLIQADFRNFSYQEVPNEYDSWSQFLPWMIIGVNDSFFKIGWRKRVIVIDWEKTQIKQQADVLFPKEEVTKGDRMIHAWGYEKATEYLKVLQRAMREG